MTRRSAGWSRVASRDAAMLKAMPSSSARPSPSRPKGKKRLMATGASEEVSWARNTTPWVSWATISSISKRFICRKILPEWVYDPSGNAHKLGGIW